MRIRALAVFFAIVAVLIGAAVADATGGGWSQPQRAVPVEIEGTFDVAPGPDGRRHAAFYSFDLGGRSGLFHATNAGGAWVAQPVGGFAENPSIAVDTDGHVFIAFARPDFPANSRGLILVDDRSGGWAHRRIVPGVVVEPAIAVHDGHVYITFHVIGGGVYLATDRSGSFQVTTLADLHWQECARPHPDIAIEPNGRVHVAYEAPTTRGGSECDSPSDGIRLVSEASGGWQTQVVSDNDWVVGPKLAVDPQGGVQLGFSRGNYSGAPWRVRHAVFRNGAWQNRDLGIGIADTLVVGEDGITHVAIGHLGVVHATLDGGAVTRRRITANGIDSHIWLGNDGGPVVMFDRPRRQSERPGLYLTRGD